MRDTTVDDFFGYLQEKHDELFSRDFNASKEEIEEEKRKIMNGVLDYKELVKKVEMKDAEVRYLKAVIKRKDETTNEMRISLMKDIIHLKENHVK